ncbi:DUF2867 domain-containing protein [Sphingobacterium siyangense]|uniref:DUF2867 domain-containing protein n=1 Tax=Sphingobacterium siyangense TaxID=459529 RepID=UPI000E73A8B4
MCISISETEKDRKRVTVCTIVQFHNWFGFLYFNLIDLVHGILIRNVLKHAIRANLQNTEINLSKF